MINKFIFDTGMINFSISPALLIMNLIHGGKLKNPLIGWGFSKRAWREIILR
jgi:hypothetical protein